MKDKIALGVVLSGLAFHLFMLFIYLGPPNLLQLQFGTLSHHYMRHFFYQNWHLFSPNPAISSSKLAVRCADQNGQWTAWKDPFAGVQERHHLTRITGYSKVLMLFGDIAQSLKKAALNDLKPCEGGKCPEDPTLTRILRDKAEALATRFAISYCSQRHPERPLQLAAVQYKILEFFPMQFTERSERDKKWEKVTELPFAPITLRQGERS